MDTLLCSYIHSVFLTTSSWMAIKKASVMMLPVCKQVALMSSFYSQPCLLLHIQEQFTMSLNLLCSTLLHLWLLIFSANSSAVERHLYVTFQYLDALHILLCSHIYLFFLTTSSWMAIKKTSLFWCLLLVNN